MPEEWNYPHSEIRAFADERHLDLLYALPEEIHLEWRELSLRHVEVFLKPNQSAEIRTHCPRSHLPELPIPPEHND